MSSWRISPAQTPSPFSKLSAKAVEAFARTEASAATPSAFAVMALKAPSATRRRRATAMMMMRVRLTKTPRTARVAKNHPKNVRVVAARRRRLTIARMTGVMLTKKTRAKKVTKRRVMSAPAVETRRVKALWMTTMKVVTMATSL